MSAHKYSIEFLIHYKCGVCARWWSIGDGPTVGIMYCPWCGSKHMLKNENEDDGDGDE